MKRGGLHQVRVGAVIGAGALVAATLQIVTPAVSSAAAVTARTPGSGDVSQDLTPAGKNVGLERRLAVAFAARQRENEEAAHPRDDTPPVTISGFGDYTATPSPAGGSWTAGGSTGSFDWSYPMRVPTPAAGPTPTVGLTYDSGSTDGRTPASNNQGSQLGEGFDLTTTSYITRSFTPCHNDGTSGHPGDLCQNGGELSLVLNGQESTIVKDDTDGTYHLSQDDDTLVQPVTTKNANFNGTWDGDYWKLTTADGTQYYFGRNRLPGWQPGDSVTNSAWVVPVESNDSGEECYHKNGTFFDNACLEAWQWNLDYVVDPNGNAETYWYSVETNYYNEGTNPSSTHPVQYDRGGTLSEIDYGLNGTLFAASGHPYQAPDVVSFTTANRCLHPTTCGPPQSNQSLWPDIPTDAICGPNLGGTCVEDEAPSFFSTQMLATVTTEVLNPQQGAQPTYLPADQWTLAEHFDYPQDDPALDAEVLMLQTVTHSGEAASQPINLPPTQFLYTWDPNQLVPDGSGLTELYRPRVTEVQTETGEVIDPVYSDGTCPDQLPPPDQNTSMCYPQYVVEEAGDQPQRAWFHKYDVQDVSIQDPGDPVTSPKIDYHYTYTHPGWHYDPQPNQETNQTTWSQWRGFRQVTTTVGSGTQSNTVDVYLQGMNTTGGCSAGSGGVQVTGVDAPAIADCDQYQGFLREHVVYNGAPNPSNIVTDDYYDPWTKQTATQDFPAHGDYQDVSVKAWMLRQKADTTTQVSMTPSGATEQRQRIVTTKYNTDGLVSTVSDTGDTSADGDESCTSNWYARNPTSWIVSLPSRVEVVDQTCTDQSPLNYPRNPNTSGDIISDHAYLYDGNADWATEQASQGNLTGEERTKSYDSSGNPTAWQQTTTQTFDTLGRVKSTADADGNTTSTNYIPAGAGVATSVTIKNPLNQATTTTLDPVWGTPTDVQDANGNDTLYDYDALGRVSDVWIPGDNHGDPSETFAYGNGDPSWSETSRINGQTGNHLNTFTFTDALGRQVQTQEPPGNLVNSASTGVTVSSITYDARGLVAEKRQDIWDSAVNPSHTIYSVSNSPVDITSTYDGAERPYQTAYDYDVNSGNPDLQYTVTNSYRDYGIATDAPTGGTGSYTQTDVLGRISQVRQYDGTGDTGSDYRSTTYSYGPTGQVSSLETSNGSQLNVNSQLSYTYDLYGRQTSRTTPNSGLVTTQYNELNQISSTTDARNDTLYYDYDKLGRVKTEAAGADDPAHEIAAWTYDQAPVNGIGRPYQAITYIGGTTGQAYTEQTDGYDALGQPTQTDLILPGQDPIVQKQALPGSTPNEVSTLYSYNPADGSQNNTQYPPLPGQSGQQTVPIHYNYSELPVTGGNVTQTAYTAEGQIVERDWGLAGHQQFAQLINTYEDATRRLTESSVDDPVHMGQGSLDVDHHYTYNASGQLLEDADTSTIGAGVDYQCYDYDGFGEIHDAWTPTSNNCQTTPTDGTLGGAAPYWNQYTYNGEGQRATMVDHGVGHGAADDTTTYTYGATKCAGAANKYANTLTSTSDTAGNSATYTCDADGNTTTRPGPTGQETLDWNQANELQEDSQAAHGGNPATDTQYIYDPTGNVIERTTTVGNDEKVALYAGGTEYDFDFQGSNSTTTGLRYLSLGSDVTELTTATTGQTGQKDYFVFPDAFGTVSLMLQNNPTMTLSKRYLDPFGNNLSTGSWPDDKGLLNDPSDATTGLTQIGLRQYDPTIGAFISSDPLTTPADPTSLNAYAYADSDPTNGSDPSGESFTGGDGESSGAGDPYHVPVGMGRTGSDEDTRVENTARYENSTSENFAEVTGDDWYTTYHAAELSSAKAAQQQSSGGGFFHWIDEHKAAILAGAATIGLTVLNVAQGGLDPLTDGAEALTAEATVDGLVIAGSDGAAALLSVGEEGLTADALAGDAESSIDAEIDEDLNSCAAQSFTADTKVVMADGSKLAISKVRVGDRVKAYNTTTGRQTTRAVKHLWRNHDHDLLNLYIHTAPGHTATLHTTDHHLFWNPERLTWVEAHQMSHSTATETLRGPDTGLVRSRVRVDGAEWMWDLTVALDHDFYIAVGGSALLVHNCAEIPSGPAPEKAWKMFDEVQANGKSPDDYKDGTDFLNDGRGGGMRLPDSTPDGDPIKYSEWDVDPLVKGVGRGAERLVTGDDGSGYYTNDHYRTFTQFMRG